MCPTCRHYSQAMWHQRPRARTCRSIGTWTIDTAPVRTGFERVGYPNHRFRSPQGQHAVGLDASCKAVEYPGLGRLVEIDQNVTTEDHVERAEMGEVLQQI